MSEILVSSVEIGLLLICKHIILFNPFHLITSSLTTMEFQSKPSLVQKVHKALSHLVKQRRALVSDWLKQPCLLPFIFRLYLGTIMSIQWCLAGHFSEEN